LALFDLAVDSMLRGCDLVRLRIGQLVVNGTARHRATVIQRRTEQPMQFELTEQTRESVLAWLELRGGALDDYVFPSRSRRDQHLSTRQYAHLLGEWVEAIGLGRSAYGTHSLRRTKVALIYKRTGNLRQAASPLACSGSGRCRARRPGAEPAERKGGQAVLPQIAEGLDPAQYR
jgi:integrase